MFEKIINAHTPKYHADEIDYLEDLIAYMVFKRQDAFKIDTEGYIKYVTPRQEIIFTPFHYDSEEIYCQYTDRDGNLNQVSYKFIPTFELEIDATRLLHQLDEVVRTL